MLLHRARNRIRRAIDTLVGGAREPVLPRAAAAGRADPEIGLCSWLRPASPWPRARRALVAGMLFPSAVAGAYDIRAVRCRGRREPRSAVPAGGAAGDARSGRQGRAAAATTRAATARPAPTRGQRTRHLTQSHDQAPHADGRRPACRPRSWPCPPPPSTTASSSTPARSARDRGAAPGSHDLAAWARAAGLQAKPARLNWRRLMKLRDSAPVVLLLDERRRGADDPGRPGPQRRLAARPLDPARTGWRSGRRAAAAPGLVGRGAADPAAGRPAPRIPGSASASCSAW